MGPVMWQGPLALKLATVSLIVMLLVSQVLGIYFPLVFKAVLDDIACDRDKAGNTCIPPHEGYFYILFYVGLKFLSELLSNIRQWPFSYIAATAEKEITRKVYTHVQNQSLQYHVCRETGKILRAV